MIPAVIIETGPLIPNLLASLALGCVLLAAGWDVFTFEIPDELSIALIVLAALWGLVTPGFDWLGHVAAPVLFFVIGLFIFSRGWLGGGDIKLITGIAAWTGLKGLLPMILATSLAGGVLSLLLIIGRRLNAGRAGPRVLAADAPLPYAVAILAGTLWWGWIAFPWR
jgi:prepilin peptidase CpaA